MDFNAIIKYLYPTAITNSDYYLYFIQGSVTPTIANWNTAKLGSQPSIASLQQAWPSVQTYQAQMTQYTLLKAAAAAAITSGFTSSALGSAHTYPSTETDQLNLTASIVASMLPNTASTWTTLFYCANAGVWSFAEHSAAEIQQVGIDAKAWIQEQQATHAGLVAKVAAATTVTAVQAVVWPA